ncbi:hypothetical protein Bbelb_062170 [Branchiostoma belcheri]|nr:hypothetical protein Bbelb_062170 [Branchiostoma belcheri]
MLGNYEQDLPLQFHTVRCLPLAAVRYHGGSDPLNPQVQLMFCKSIHLEKPHHPSLSGLIKMVQEMNHFAVRYSRSGITDGLEDVAGFWLIHVSHNIPEGTHERRATTPNEQLQPHEVLIGFDIRTAADKLHRNNSHVASIDSGICGASFGVSP